MDFHVPPSPVNKEESNLALLLEIAGWALFVIFGIAFPLVIINTVLASHQPGWQIPAFFVCCLVIGSAIFLVFRFMATVLRFLDKNR